MTAADNIPLPNEGRLVGVDFGTVRIGLATCDPSQTWVSPLATYRPAGPDKDQKFFMKLAEEEGVVGWVIGLPIHCDGKESQKSKEVREFAEWLTQGTDLPHALYDERFTTAEARRMLGMAEISSHKKKQRLDQVAAHLILSHFLDSRRSSDSGNIGIDDAWAPL